jgi:PAS domain-containing protein
MVVQGSQDQRLPRLFRHGEWRYAIQVILLLAVAGIASKLAMDALARHPGLREAEEALNSIAVTLFSLTFGFLFLTGGFGIWAIRTTNEIEGRRRIGRFVDEMGYLSDPLLAVDRRGRVTGMNPSARRLAGRGGRGRRRIEDLFPCLTSEDVEGLVARREPYEVERALRGVDGTLQALRFRSQYSRDARVVLVSDVTAAKTRQARDLQRNHLQILGRLARGVAHDFNNVLCAISAEAALARRPGTSTRETARALDAIAGLSVRGAELADRLARLSRIEAVGEPARDVAEHLERAADLLRTALDPAWAVEVSSPVAAVAVPLGGQQLEQILVGIGLNIGDAPASPGTLRMAVERTEGEQGRDSEDPSRVTICVEAADLPGDGGQGWNESGALDPEDIGVVASVIRSLLEDLGGKLVVYPARNGSYGYRITLPTLRAAEERVAAGLGLPAEVRSALEGCRTLLALPQGRQAEDLAARLRVLGARLAMVQTLPDLLGRIDRDPVSELLVIDRLLLGGEADPLLRAIRKLLPSAILVVLSGTPVLDRVGMPEEIEFVATGAPPDSVIEAMARARRPATAGAIAD